MCFQSGRPSPDLASFSPPLLYSLREGETPTQKRGRCMDVYFVNVILFWELWMSRSGRLSIYLSVSTVRSHRVNWGWESVVPDAVHPFKKQHIWPQEATIQRNRSERRRHRNDAHTVTARYQNLQRLSFLPLRSGEGKEGSPQTLFYRWFSRNKYSLWKADQPPTIPLWKDTQTEDPTLQRALKVPLRKGNRVLVKIVFSLSCLFSWPFFSLFSNSGLKKALLDLDLQEGDLGFCCLNIRPDVSITPLDNYMPAAVTCFATTQEKLRQKGSN